MSTLCKALITLTLLLAVSLTAVVGQDSDKKATDLKWAKGVVSDFLTAALANDTVQAQNLMTEAAKKSFKEQGENALAVTLANKFANGVGEFAFKSFHLQQEEIAPDQDEAVFRGTLTAHQKVADFTIRTLKEKDSGKWRVHFFLVGKDKKPLGEKKLEAPQENPKSPREVVRALGVYETAKLPSTSVLLQRHPQTKRWQRLADGASVLSGTPLVSLPGYRSAVQVGDVRLVLWGNFMTLFWKEDLAYQLDYDRSAQQTRELDPKAAPPPFPLPPLLEARVVLHDNNKVDLDLTLQRGRIVIANTKQGKQPVKIRLRFANPTNPEVQQIWDVELPYQHCEIAVERWSYFPFTEPFVEDRQSPRPGPVAHVELFCLKGEAKIEMDGKVVVVDEPVGFSRLVWNSRRGKVARLAMEKVPEWVKVAPPATPRMNKEELEKIQQVTRNLALDLKGNNLDVVFKKAVLGKATVPCMLAVRCLAALDDEANLSRLIDALEDADHHTARVFAIDSLRYWIALHRDNDYRLYDLLSARYRRPNEKKSGEAAIVMGLLHDYPETARFDKNVYGALIGYLGSNRLAIRELAYWRLVVDYYPEGQKLQYSPIAAPAQRQAAIERWTALLQAGGLPPMPMPKKK